MHFHITPWNVYSKRSKRPEATLVTASSNDNAWAKRKFGLLHIHSLEFFAAVILTHNASLSKVAFSREWRQMFNKKFTRLD